MQSNEPWLVYSELNFPEHVTHINIFPANSEQQQQHQQQKQPPFPPQKYWKQQNQTALQYVTATVFQATILVHLALSTKVTAPTSTQFKATTKTLTF